MEQSTKKIYLAYGSNLNVGQMGKRCPSAKVLGAGELKNYEILFRGANNNAVATIEPKEGANVPVVLWEITKSDEKSLDRYEGWPFMYRKEKVNVELDGKLVETMAYIMNEKGKMLGKPSSTYYNTIMEGYSTHGFNPEVIDSGVANSVLGRKQEKLERKAAKAAKREENRMQGKSWTKIFRFPKSR